MPASTNDVNVLGHVAALLREEESVDDFIDWFWPALFHIHAYGSDDDFKMSARIENRLAELSGGYIDDAELLEGLRDDAEEFGIAWQPVAETAGTPRLAS